MEFGTSVGAERDAGRDALIMEIVGMVLAGLATGGVANTLGGGFAAARAGGASRLGAAGAGLSKLAGQGGASPAMGGGPWGRGPFNVGGQYVGRGSRVGQVEPISGWRYCPRVHNAYSGDGCRTGDCEVADRGAERRDQRCVPWSSVRTATAVVDGFYVGMAVVSGPRGDASSARMG